MSKLVLKIITGKGAITDEFDTRMKVRHVKMRALIKANYTESGFRALNMADRCYITHQGRRLTDEATLENVSVPDGSSLNLEGPFYNV